LTRIADGGVLLTLKAEWTDGTTHLLFEPVEVLERLAALTRRPRSNLVLHHGVLAPHSQWQARAVAYGRDTLALPDVDLAVAPRSEPARPAHRPSPRPPRSKRRRPVRRHAPGPGLTFCATRSRWTSWRSPRCGGRMRVLATIDDPSVIRKILTHLGLPTEASAPRPPPSDLFDFDWS
jgi:hypothetical protein